MSTAEAVAIIENRDKAFEPLPPERLCRLLGISRSSLYRHRAGLSLEKARRDADLRDRIEEILVDFPGYGYRRVAAQLRRNGITVNRKRVLSVMRKESLLCQVKRSFVITTDSEHGFPVYRNLAIDAEVTGLNQLWVADITYIRLPLEFCYLAAVLDAYSRRVVGWHLARYLDVRLPLFALKMALEDRQPEAGFIHHSDRGVQYACREYVDTLKQANARISMSAKGKPRDNAQAESFFRTLKMEEVYLQDYGSFLEADARIEHFIETVYNRKRLHSALDYQPPVEFEEQLARSRTS